MKKAIFTTLFCLAALWQATAAPLMPQQKTALRAHLLEINKQWSRWSAPTDFEQATFFPDDRARIARHLFQAEQMLRRRDVSALSAAQRSNRAHLLDVLCAYRTAGVFPTNHYHAHRQPYFVDNFGVHCAVGYLVSVSGGGDLVEKIRREDNFGYLHDLARKYPQIGAWAAENGFALDELALIQPAYQVQEPNYATWGNGGGLNPGGQIYTMLESWHDQKLVVAGSFSQIDGFSANNIVAWDGQSWSKLGDGLTGEVYDLANFYTGLVAVGNFTVPGDPGKRNVALWDGQTWKGLQTGDMGGTVTSACALSVRVYLGGDFTKFDGQPVKYLAALEGNFAGDFTRLDLPVLSVNGPVNFVENINNFLLVGGEFTQTSASSNIGNQLNVKGLAYFDYTDWVNALSDYPGPTPIAATKSNGYLVVGHAPDDIQNCGHTLDAGLWQPLYAHSENLTGGGVFGFFKNDEEAFAYGDFLGGGLYTGYGLCGLQDGSLSGLADANGAVLAGAVYKNEVYFAGEFTELHQNPYPGLARIKDASNSIPPEPAGFRVQLYFSEGEMVARYENLAERTLLRWFDATGRCAGSMILGEGSGEERSPAGGLQTGIYFCEISNSKQRSARKLWVSN